MNLKLAGKINLMFIVILILFSMSLGLVLNSKIREGIKEFAIEKAKSDLNLSYTYIDATYPGDWQIINDQLYKGENLINNEFQLVDQIGKDTGGTITIFQGNTRVSTNVFSNGQRAVGTQVSAEVEEAVLNRQETFYGEANVAGNVYQAAYKPLVDANNNVIGIIYVGAPQNIIDKIIDSVLTSFILSIIITFIVSGIAISIFSNRIKKRLTNIVNVLKLAGAGDFTNKLSDPSKDELAQVAESYNEMANQLSHLVKDVGENTNSVTSTANELTILSAQNTESFKLVTNAVNTISENVNEQQLKLEHTAMAVNEMTDGITHVSENATHVAEASNSSIERAKEGHQTVETLIKQMNTIVQANASCNEVLLDLEKKSQEIGLIIDAITDIANETNLLALNAAIEAARAGENGKSFAVVAAEVRKLSSQSNASATNISSIIEAIQTDTKKLVQFMGATNEEISNGLNTVQLTGEKFNQIQQSVQYSNVGIQELSAIAEQMNASMQEINATIENIAELSKVTATDATDITKSVANQQEVTEAVKQSIENLNNQSSNLKQLLTKFNA